MRTEAASAPEFYPGAPRSLAIRRSTLAGVLVAVATMLSTIVFSEPAIADGLMVVVIGVLPVLGVLKFGKASFFNYSAWLALFALGFVGTMLSTTFPTAFVHQLVTLFLATGAFVIAGYVAEDPEPRAKLVLSCYVIACLIATAAAFVGYFRLIPSTYELFTNYDRARGTFKDPNVYSAAVAPAIVSLVWVMLRGRPKHALVAAAVAFPLVIGLLISFSRGAWISTALSVCILIGIVLFRSRRSTDFNRFGKVTIIGIVGLMGALALATQIDQVRDLLSQRANLDQSYDEGPNGRFGGQQKARALIVEHPFGIGTHTFRDTYHHEEPHNVYLTMFLNAGWLGGLLYVLSVVATLYLGLRTALQRTRLQGPAVIAFASFAGLAFEGFVIDSDHWRHFFLMAGLIWGLADATPPVSDPRRRADDVEA
ncbi:O-antigen ligase [Hyphomicrobium sp. 99]|uniref:O-antigen ligase family protein n=1 Tax=Hyphomicrobium sp. 99 TaxID=1163419 RepID=UPI000698C597|nr:O-antigen ligase family protein [Hyphomicrobium sp. 99]